MWTRRSVAPSGTDLYRRRVTAGVTAGTVLLSSGSFVVFPLLPALQEDLGVTTTGIGLVAAAGFAAALTAELLVAPLADRGRTLLLGVGGVLLLVAALVVAAAAADVHWLIASRAIGGFGVGAFMAAASALMVRADPARSGESLGRLGAAELAGISLGPLAAGLLVSVASPAAILAGTAAVVALAVAPVALSFSERPAPAPPAADLVEGAGHPPVMALDLLRSPQVIGLLLLHGAVMIPNGAYDGIWPRFMADIGAGEVLTALSYTLFAVPYVLLAGWAGRLADRRGGVAAYVRGLLILTPLILLYGVVGHPWIATGVGFFESTGQALAFVGVAAAMAQTIPAERAGASQGLMRAFGLLAATAAAALSGVLYEAGGAILLFGATVGLVLLVAGVGLLALRPRVPLRTPAGPRAVIMRSVSGSGR